MLELFLGGQGAEAGRQAGIPPPKGAPIGACPPWLIFSQLIGLVLSFHSIPIDQWYLVHVQCRQCLTDFTSVNVDLPKTRWETRESETVSLLYSYQSHTHLTHFQTMNRNEFQLHYRSVASISFIRMYQRQAVSRP